MYIKLLLTFAYIGAFTFGGGYAMLPMFQRELVEKNKWLSEEEMIELFSVSQCLPGIIAANTAVFVGYKHKGILGGIVSAIGVVLPSLVVIMIIAAFLTNFADIPAVQRAFMGLRVCVSVLILNAVFKLRKHSVVDIASAGIFVIIFILSVYMFLPVAVLVLFAGLCGIGISTVRKRSTPTGSPPDDLINDDSDADNTDVNEILPDNSALDTKSCDSTSLDSMLQNDTPPDDDTPGGAV